MAPTNPSKIWRQIFLANANLNGLAIDNNQSRTSSKHFDPPLFQNPYKIINGRGGKQLPAGNHSLSSDLVKTRTSITYNVQLRFTTSLPWNISHPTKVKENWPSKITFIKYNGEGVPRGDFVLGDFVQGVLSERFCPRTL